MANRSFRTLTEAMWKQRRFLCVGLDSDFSKLPPSFQALGPKRAIIEFNRAIVDATKEVAGSYKPNSAFFEAYGAEGIEALKASIGYIREAAPGAPIILDAKRADIGNTNHGYASFAFDYLAADALTVHPYLGKEALEPLLSREDKCIIVLCRTSNAGAGEFQDAPAGGESLYMRVARHVRDEWNGRGNCALVVGATYPEEMRAIRAAADDLPFLVPGVGAQGGDLATAVSAARDSRGAGFMISVSRAILYASSDDDFADAAYNAARTFHTAVTDAV